MGKPAFFFSTLLSGFVVIIAGVVILLGSQSVSPRLASDAQVPPILPTPAYVCPPKLWVNCLTSVEIHSPLCQPAYLLWAKTNCSGFQGARR